MKGDQTNPNPWRGSAEDVKLHALHQSSIMDSVRIVRRPCCNALSLITPTAITKSRAGARPMPPAPAW